MDDGESAGSYKQDNGVPVLDAAGYLLGVVTAQDLVHRAADERLEPREYVWKENSGSPFLDSKVKNATRSRAVRPQR